MWIGLVIHGEFDDGGGFVTSRWCEAESPEDALDFHAPRIAAELAKFRPGEGFTLEIVEAREFTKTLDSREGTGFTFY